MKSGVPEFLVEEKNVMRSVGIAPLALAHALPEPHVNSPGKIEAAQYQGARVENQESLTRLCAAFPPDVHYSVNFDKLKVKGTAAQFEFRGEISRSCVELWRISGSQMAFAAFYDTVREALGAKFVRKTVEYDISAISGGYAPLDEPEALDPRPLLELLASTALEVRIEATKALSSACNDQSYQELLARDYSDRLVPVLVSACESDAAPFRRSGLSLVVTMSHHAVFCAAAASLLPVLFSLLSSARSAVDRQQAASALQLIGTNSSTLSTNLSSQYLTILGDTLVGATSRDLLVPVQSILDSLCDNLSAPLMAAALPKSAT